VKILFIADIVGEPGRRAVRLLLPEIRTKHQIDIVIANAENSAGGSGVTEKTANELFACGINVLTSGDHIWDQKEIIGFLDTTPRLLRPLNYPPNTPGNGSYVLKLEDKPPVAVVNLQGRTYMPPIENPFVYIENEIKKLQTQTPIIIVDFHAEASSEKMAMGRFLDGRVTAVVGTHTHAQTADEQVFPGGTAFVTDAGFTGPHESILGRDIEPIIKRFLTGLPQKFPVAKDKLVLQGVLITLNEQSGRAQSIIRISEALVETNE